MAGFADGCHWPQSPLPVQQAHCSAALPEQDRSFADHLQPPPQQHSLWPVHVTVSRSVTVLVHGMHVKVAAAHCTGHRFCTVSSCALKRAEGG